MNKEEVYQKIYQEVSNRGLGFKQIDKGTGVDIGFIISNHSTEIYGNILSNVIQGENIYQAITKTLYDFYESDNARNFLVLVDTIENHFLVLPYEILKSVMYDRRSGDGVHKDFHITRHPYRLTRNKLPLSEYVDNLALLFEEKKPQDYLEYKRQQNQYFLIQVNRAGSENLLKNGVYQHENWMYTPHDNAHGNVRIGDILVIYFASNSIEFQKQVKKIYRVNSALFT